MEELLDLIEFALAVIGFFASIVFLSNYFREREISNILKKGKQK